MQSQWAPAVGRQGDFSDGGCIAHLEPADGVGNDVEGADRQAALQQRLVLAAQRLPKGQEQRLMFVSNPALGAQMAGFAESC